MEQTYYIINVPHHKYGYSFAVKTIADEEEVIGLAKAKGLFQEEIDADYATVEEMFDEYDKEAFPEEQTTDLDTEINNPI